MLFSLLKHYLDLYISDTALKVSRSLYCFTTSICHGVENYFPRLWGTGISDAIFLCHQHLCCVSYRDCFVIQFYGVGICHRHCRHTLYSREYLKNGLSDLIQIWHVDVTGPGGVLYPQGVPYFKVTLNSHW